ncbi:MAG TPA: hypothetical protein VK420_02900, partial [Longimicrobium sp.]|nr:hypothetical protein [Longimicrobium sp.]
NLASRLEGAAKVYGTRMLVAHETVEQARGMVRARELDWLRVKGKAQPVRVYEVLCRHTVEVPAHVETYARGLALYRERRFDAALEAFSAIADIDPPARVFRERCQQLLAHPPGPEWDGVYSLDSK